MDDAGAIAVAEAAARLAGRFLLPEQPAGLPESVADKAALAERCHAAGLAHPDTVRPRSAAGGGRGGGGLGLPLVAKWSRPWLLPPPPGCAARPRAQGAQARGSTNAPARQAVRCCSSARAGRAGAFGLVLPRLLRPGMRAACWAARAARSVPGRRTRGLTAVGRWLPNPEVEAAARKLAGDLGYQGILDLDFRQDPVSGAYQLLDFNPRPGAQFRLFADRAGLDVVRALHLNLTGRPVPETAGAPGRVLRVENYALLSALTAPGRRPRRTRRQPPYVRLPRLGETAWFAADDPAPFLAMARASLDRGLRKGLRRTFAQPGALPRPAVPPAAPAPGAAPASGQRRRADSRATTAR